MAKKDKTRYGGISIHVIHITIILCAIAIAVLLLFSTYQSMNVFSKLSTETGNYISNQKAAHDLMEASDYLTEMVRRFTLEGNTTYLNNYFDEAFVTKRREASIVTMSENTADQSLVEGLQEAMEESLSLMYREYYAMKLVIEAREIQEYPETLKAIELSEEDSFLSPDEKMSLAQKMVMDSEYYAAKGRIRTNLKNNLELLDQQMNTARRSASTNLMRELTIIRIVIIILTVLLIILIAVTARLSTLPLLQASECIRKKEPIPVAGSKEFRQLADSYNEMYGSLHNADSQ